jgi:hypothetical protein
MVKPASHLAADSCEHMLSLHKVVFFVLSLEPYERFATQKLSTFASLGFLKNRSPATLPRVLANRRERIL